MKELKNETFEVRITKWVGSRSSLIAHTLLFIAAFILILLGISEERVLLILTTIVSLEAIYLAIFIQMSVNKNTESLQEVEEDIEDIQEDVEEISEDIEDLHEDVEEIGEDVGEITEDIDEIQEEFQSSDSEEKDRMKKHEITHEQLAELQKTLQAIMKEIDDLKSRR